MPQELNDRASVLTDRQLGKTQYITREGYLYCDSVRIARHGPLLYRDREVQKVEAVNGLVTLNRDASELFEEDTVLSFSGKPITNDHPPQMLTADNVTEYAVGTVLNPRQGVDEDDGYLVADFLVMDANTIADIKSGKREVSCGYYAEIEQVMPGVGRQYRIRGNHVALVIRGRAGPACAIQDSNEEPPMPTEAKKPNLLARLFGVAKTSTDHEDFQRQLALADADSDAEEKKDEDKDGDKKDEEKTDKASTVLDAGSVTELMNRFSLFETRLGQLETRLMDTPTTANPNAPDVTRKEPMQSVLDEGADKKDDEKKDEEEKKDSKEEAMDAATVITASQSFHDSVARAEILVPGIKVPKFDPKSSTANSESIQVLQRQTLSAVFLDTAKAKIVEPILGGKKALLHTLAPSELETCFIAASEVVKARNNTGRQQAITDKAPMSTIRVGSQSPDQYQKLMTEARERNAEKPATTGRSKA